jgi:hypothetical protein
LHLAREAVRPGRANGIRSAFLLGAERVIAIDTTRPALRRRRGFMELPRKRAAQLPPRNAEKIKRRNGTRSASQALEGGISVLAPICASILFVATVGLNAMALQKVSDYGFICRRERCCESALDSFGRPSDRHRVCRRVYWDCCN